MRSRGSHVRVVPGAPDCCRTRRIVLAFYEVVSDSNQKLIHYGFAMAQEDGRRLWFGGRFPFDPSRRGGVESGDRCLWVVVTENYLVYAVAVQSLMRDQRHRDALDSFPVSFEQPKCFVPVLLVEVCTRTFQSDATGEL